MALEVARELAAGYPDGAWFVSHLTAISEASELAALVSSTLKGLVRAGAADVVLALAAALRSERTDAARTTANT